MTDLTPIHVPRNAELRYVAEERLELNKLDPSIYRTDASQLA